MSIYSQIRALHVQMLFTTQFGVNGVGESILEIIEILDKHLEG
jgi:hypothetical protein